MAGTLNAYSSTTVTVAADERNMNEIMQKQSENTAKQQQQHQPTFDQKT